MFLLQNDKMTNPFTKIISKFSGNLNRISRSLKTRKDDFYRICEKSIFEKFLVSFQTISIKLENQQKILENDLEQIS